MAGKNYTIDELSESTGLSRRTIRYYVQLGLINSPSGRGRGGFYNDSQVERLKQVKSLQAMGMNLSSIIEYLKAGNIEEAGSRREVWIKHEVMPGLEISVRRDLEEKESKKISEIMRVIKSILKEGS